MDLSPYDELRRRLHEALPLGPGFPSPGLMDRILAELTTPSRTARRQRTLSALAALLLLTVASAAFAVPRLPRLADAGRIEFLSSAGAGRVEFLSTTAQPATEYRDMNRYVLAGFNGSVDFNSQPTGAQDVERIGYERSTGRSTVDLLALTSSDMARLQEEGALEDLTPLLRRLQQDRRFPQSVLDLGRSKTGELSYIPWVQTTYMMVVNKKALVYLPEGADVKALTYDQLIAWGQRIEEKTGEKRIGLPADLNGSRGGLVYRFLQGYAYPSFTGNTLTGFRSLEAVQMWDTLRRLWAVTNQWSTTYTRMDDPLASGEVWIAWDHQARLKDAAADGRFLTVPAPTGPQGLGYLSVVVGLAIPKGAPNRAGAEALIDWLTRPKQQAAVSASLSFFPVVEGVALGGAQAAEYGVAKTYEDSALAVQTVLPAGLGTRADDFTAIYQETFRRIVLQGEDVEAVLDEEAARLQQLVDDVGAPCWPPDPPSRGPCQIK